MRVMSCQKAYISDKFRIREFNAVFQQFLNEDLIVTRDKFFRLIMCMKKENVGTVVIKDHGTVLRILVVDPLH